MAFPTTSVLTTFTGADEDPLSEGGNWAGPTRDLTSHLKRVSNAVARSAISGTVGDYWTPNTFGPDTEVFCTMGGTFDESGGTIQVMGRVQNPTSDTIFRCYLAAYTQGTGFRCFKDIDTTFTQIGSTDATVASVGDKIGLEVIGTAIKCYHFTGGSWVQRVSGTDSDISTAGNLALEIASSNNMRADDFGGGTVITAVTPTLAWLSA